MSLELMPRTCAILLGCLLTVTATWAAAADSAASAHGTSEPAATEPKGTTW